jgi:hypothetical protein
MHPAERSGKPFYLVFIAEKKNAYPCKRRMDNIPLPGLCKSYIFATIHKVVFWYICNNKRQIQISESIDNGGELNEKICASSAPAADTYIAWHLIYRFRHDAYCRQ